ncbi:hypothetical protein BOTBODRAFT_77711, partial [Botryobasidium botryosum FD-172 SS1]
PKIRRFVWEHFVKINKILHRASQVGICFSLKKLQLFRERVTLLGQDIAFKGHVPDKLKIERIKTWKMPTSLTEVRSFLGFAG